MPKILVIDDDDQVRDMLHQLLEMEGYEVMEAANGKQAIEIRRREAVDIIITDLIMPEKEGIETIRELKELFPDIKIIAMSGGGVVGPEAYLKIAKGLGAQKAYVKPIEREKLLRGVRELLEK